MLFRSAVKWWSRGWETRTTVSVCWAKNVFPPRDDLAKAPGPALAPADDDARIEVDQDESRQVLPPSSSPSLPISQTSKSRSASPLDPGPTTTFASATDDFADAWLSGLGISIGPVPAFSPLTPSPPTPDIEPPLAVVAPEPTPSPPPASPTSSTESDLRAKVVESLVERKRIASAAAQLARSRPPPPFFTPVLLFPPTPYFTVSPTFFPSPTYFGLHPFAFPPIGHHAPQRTNSAPSSSPAAAPPILLRRRSLESVPIVKAPAEPWLFPSGCVGDGVIEFSDDDDEPELDRGTARTDHLAYAFDDQHYKCALGAGELFPRSVRSRERSSQGHRREEAGRERSGKVRGVACEERRYVLTYLELFDPRGIVNLNYVYQNEPERDDLRHWRSSRRR